MTIDYSNNLVTITSDNSTLVKTITILPVIVDITQTKYHNPLDDFNFDHDEFTFTTPNLTIRNIDYVDIQGELWIPDPRLDVFGYVSIYSGTRKQFAHLPRHELKSHHKITKNAAINIAKDIETNFNPVIISNLQAILNAQLRNAVNLSQFLINQERQRLDKLEKNIRNKFK